MTFLLDTGSDITWLPTKNCPKYMCGMDVYNFEKSKAFKNYRMKDIIYYVKGTVKGVVMKDNFSLDYNHTMTVKDLDFLGVYWTDDLNLKSDGLLGLGPSKYLENYPNDRRAIVDQMKKSGVIDKAVFAVQLGKIDTTKTWNLVETESYIKFGGWDEYIVQDSMLNPEENERGIKWFTPLKKSSWEIRLNSFKVND